MTQTINDILSRHSVRSYLPEPVEGEHIKLILEAGAAAPHGLELKSLRFTAVAAPDRLAQVNAAIRDAFRNIPVTEGMHPIFKSLVERSAAADANYTYGAPVFVIISTNEDNSYAKIDTALAIENILLAAHSLGLGACWMNQLAQLVQAPPVLNLLRELGIPEGNTVVGTVVIGHPAGKDNPAPRREPEIDLYL